MRKWAWAAVLFAVSLSGLAQEVGIDARPDLQIDHQRTRWIEHVINSIATIKPGMTRQDLSHTLTSEGGLSTRTQRKYVYKHCPLIKVDVEFSAVDKGTDESPADKIVKISRPYLEYSISD